MSINVLITPQAQKQIAKLSKLAQLAVVNKIRALSAGTANLQITKLSGHKDIYRVRVADYRIVYQQAGQSITIILVKHRRDVYRGW